MSRCKDCAWLFEIYEDTYHCCDSRSLHSGKELDAEQILQEACEFFHPKNENQKSQDDFVALN